MSDNGRRTGRGDHDITISGTLISKVMAIAVVVIFLCAVLLCALLGIAGVVGAVRLVQFLCTGLSLA